MTLTGPTPILDTVYRSDAAGLARLLAAGGRPALFEAAVGHAAVVRQLAAENPAAVGVHAAIAGAAGARVVAALLRHGADVNAEDAGGHRPLHLAAFEGDAETVQTLLAHGAADAPTHDGRTALAIAEERGHAAIARRLRGELP
jgi:hypothetical protein